MAKTHQVTKSGGAVMLLLSMTALASKDILIANIRAGGEVLKETACVAQDLTGGMVAALDCTTSTVSPSATSAEGD